MFLRLGLSNQIFYPASWKFKPWLIHDPNFESFLKEQVKLFLMDNKTPDVSPNLLWDTAKAYIRGLIISYVSNQKKKQLADQRKLEMTLHGLQIKYNMHPSDGLLAEIETVKTSLEAILTNKAEKSVFFARQRMYEFANKPNKYLANLLRNRSQAHVISSIKDKEGRCHHDNKAINKIFRGIL